MHDPSDLEQRLSSIEYSVAQLRAEIGILNDANAAIGRWLKALANNDLLVMQATMMQLTRAGEERGREITEQLFRFRDEINEKILTDDTE